MIVNEAECEFADVDAKAVARLARRLTACGKEAKRLHLTVFGGSGSGSLRAHLSPGNGGVRPLILATLGGPHVWDGGDGAACAGEDGLMRGE